MRCRIALTTSVALLFALGSHAVAQQGPSPKVTESPAGESKAKTTAKPKAKPKTDTKAQAPAQPPPQAVPPQVVMPDAEKIVVMVRTTLITLNDAIQTGNFTVLRDIGAPGFREANSAARLSQIFSDLTSRGIDLSAVATMVPQLAEDPSINPSTNMLRLKGTFPGNPVQIDFELLFQPVAGRWRLFGITVQPKG